MVAGLVSLPVFPHSHYPGERSSTALASSPSVAIARSGARSPLGSSDQGHLPSQYQGQLYCLAQTRYRALSLDCCKWCVGVSSSTLLLTGLAHLCSLGRVRSKCAVQVGCRVHSPVCYVLELMRNRTGSIITQLSGSALSPAMGDPF